MSQQKKQEFLRTFSETLRAIRTRRGWTQEELAAKLGVTAGAVGNWESMTNGPSRSRIKRIADKLGVTVEFLTTGEPSPYPGPSKASAGTIMRDDVRLADKPFTQAVPVVSWARAGAAEFNYSDLAEYLDETVQTDCRDENAFALIVEGDSMEPAYKTGDRLVIAPNAAARNGDVVIARLTEEGSVLFKLFHQTGPQGETIKLTSYNPMYPPLEYPLHKFRFIYPVWGMYRKTMR